MQGGGELAGASGEGHVAAVVCHEPGVLHWGYDKAIFADTIPPRAGGHPG